MVDCDFDPSLPECQAADNPMEDEPMMMEEEEVDLMGWTPLFDKPMPDQGQMVYTTVALTNTVYYALKMFRYRSASGFYDAGKGADGNGTNLWFILNTIKDYSSLLMWSVLGVFNLVSSFGVAVELNAMFWDI